jgi:hypothetical protein
LNMHVQDGALFEDGIKTLDIAELVGRNME